MKRALCLVPLILACLAPVPSAFAQAAAGSPQADSAPMGTPGYKFVTLGTQGGPMPSMTRSEPANLLIKPGTAYLVDAGDDAMTRAIGAGAQFPWIRGVFISHLHFDHIGGLFAVLGLRHQTKTTTPFTIYGPPGTRDLVAGLLAAMEPSARSGYGVPGEQYVSPGENIKTVELDDGAVVKLDDMTVRVAANSHYSFTPGSPEAKRFRSLSFRFDLPDRSIVYTGDTGPSPAVEKLAIGADLLVTEMIDLDAILARMKQRAGDMPQKVADEMVAHLSKHHLTTRDVGEMATRAGAGSVVVTHFAGGASRDAVLGYAREINRYYTGPVVIAADMDSF